MEQSILLQVGVIALVFILAGGLFYYFYVMPKSNSKISSMVNKARHTDSNARQGRSGTYQPTEAQLAELNKRLTVKAKKKNVVTQEDKFFRAGLFAFEDRETFFKIKIYAPIILSVLLGLAGYILIDVTSGLVGFVLGVLMGMQLPQSYIDRKIKRRNEDIMFYLPLVIEQIVIGVSSSLDPGPCIQRVISMADERNSHNPVTELLRHAQQFAKSGVSFEESMNEVGTLSGHPELKHAFKSLAQVAKYGGEISKQLQELADSVSSQRETMIEGKIKRLELEATGPVGLVFFGFMIIFLAGLGAQVMKAFK